MPYCEMQQEATRNRGPENTWEAIGRMVKTMALDAVASQFTRMDQTTAIRPCCRNDGCRIDEATEVKR